ncbi:hypothetical protein COLO4_18030 [Corchorus olitorius]|uniref:Uncharacterized protein n=1 Tax=Corchorus olitorius TaxID=93759 RepID=A0A1R3JAQ8_9ROSI|nr:hypothetical protein COLO4_18030 [Corchorus olitorius]
MAEKMPVKPQRASAFSKPTMAYFPFGFPESGKQREEAPKPQGLKSGFSNL